MPLTHFSQINPMVRRLRPASPSCRGGASSLLRLTQPACARLPSAPYLADLISRAAGALMPVTGPLADLTGGGAAAIGGAR